MLLRRISAVCIAVLYGTALTALPLLHQAEHAAHGEDHVHTDTGIVYLGETPDPGALDHSALDASLAALGLADAFTAGTNEVDCGYAEYTLVEACATHAPTDHAIAFGDSLLHQHKRDHRAADPEHGLHSLAHGGAQLLAASPILVPPAPTAMRMPPAPPVEDSLISRAQAQPSSRGPPASV